MTIITTYLLIISVRHLIVILDQEIWRFLYSLKLRYILNSSYMSLLRNLSFVFKNQVWWLTFIFLIVIFSLMYQLYNIVIFFFNLLDFFNSLFLYIHVILFLFSWWYVSTFFWFFFIFTNHFIKLISKKKIKLKYFFDKIFVSYE